jgi:hypothetical protein
VHHITVQALKSSAVNSKDNLHKLKATVESGASQYNFKR